MQMNATFNHKSGANPAGEQQPFLSPSVDIYESADRYWLEADLPGVSKDSLEITLEGHMLTLVGHRRNEVLPTALHRESATGSFRRVFELAPTIDSSKIRAQMDQGLLKLELPKREQAKPRQISIS